MASKRISAPMRGVAFHLSRLPVRRDLLSIRALKSTCTPQIRSITTSTSSQASIASLTTSTADYVPVRPIEEQTVLATIHQFPSLEPLRFETYPANHLYLPTRKDILHRAVVYEGDMTRLGTASTKNRHEVQGSRRKVRPQKGSGRARLGDKKSPMLRGGGVAFGPRPRDFATELPKKVYDLAWRTALSYRFRKGELIIVDNAMEIESPSTRLLNDIFKHHEKLRGKGRSLLVTLDERPLLEEALAEMDRAEQTLTWREVDVKNLLELSRVIIERDALQNILLTHQEDLTHVSLQPWHKSLARSTPPSDLEAIIGWAEFRDLQRLDPKNQKTARPAAFESVASQRYALAETLPQGVKRDDLTRSAYELIAESKELQFEEASGLPFSDYATQVQEIGEAIVDKFPRIEVLDYQRDLKLDRAAEASKTSQIEGEEIELEVAELNLQRVKVQREASLLAAQVWEHLDVAQRLSGDEEAAEESVSFASGERTNLDILDQNIAEAEIKVVEQKITIAQLQWQIAKAEDNFIGQRTAQNQLTALKEERDAKVAAQLAAQASVEDVVENDEVLEAPIVESTSQKDGQAQR